MGPEGDSQDADGIEAAFDMAFGEPAEGGEGDASPAGEDAGREESSGDTGANAGDGTGAAGQSESPEAGAPSSGSQPDPSDADAAAGGQNDELERLKQHARTTEGRLAAAEADRQALQRQVEALRGADGQGGQPKDGETPGPVELPEDLRPDAEEFDALYPELQAALRAPGKAGDHMRRLLRDSGADMAALYARQEMILSRVDQGFETVASTATAKSQREHLERVAERHPEIQGFLGDDPQARQAAGAYVSDIRQWVETLPYAAAKSRLQVLQDGTAAQVVALIDEYKTRNTSPESELDAETRRRASDAEGIANRRGSRPPRGGAAKSAVDVAFDRTFSD